MTVKEKIAKIRQLMKEYNISVYVVKSSDYHDSEYTGEFFEERKFLSGFTGSAGTLIVGMEQAGLYTDGRYFIQASHELQGTGIDLMKMGCAETIPATEYIENILCKGTFLAADARTIPAKEGKSYEQLVEKKNAAGFLSIDLVEKIWEERPSISMEPAFELGIEYAGETRMSKLSRVREFMQGKKADCHILTTLDDIAWLLNIRGNDIAYNPMVLAYLYMDDHQVYLFTEETKFSDGIIKSLNTDNVFLRPYNDFYDYITGLESEQRVLLDQSHINYQILKSLGNHVLIDEANPEIMMKAVKNATEVDNERKAHIKDGIAVTKFIYWLKNNIGKMDIDERTAADYLEELRKKQEGYIEPSFTTISAYNANAAMMHYNPYANEPAELKAEGLLLVDSGGQYYEGTTDITRTIGLGPVDEVIKKHYTAVLRGMLNLANAKFLKGCSGLNLDILARGPMWDMGIDYRCGTGHGVGYLLGVHEAPNGFRYKHVPERNDGCNIVPGMITTDEPGVYIEGSHGIRIEMNYCVLVMKSMNMENFCLLIH